MDIHRILNTPNRPPIRPNLPPTPPFPRTPTRPRAKETTRSDRIRIKTALDWGTPRIVWRRYKDIYGYTLRQIQDTRRVPITPQKKGKVGRKPTVPEQKIAQLKEWLLADPAHRFVSFHHLPIYAPDLELQEYGFEAIRTAFRSIGYGRRVAKRKGFSSDPRVMAQRLAFAQEAITWTRERLYRQAFSDEVWAHGGAFTQAYVTVLVDGDIEAIQEDRYRPECLQHKYGKQPAWMFHGVIYNGKKSFSTFWEKEWGSMDSTKYNLVILSQVQDLVERERAQGIRLIWQHDGASCHRSFETQDNLYRRNIPSIDHPPYSPDLNLIEHVWSWMKRYIQEHYFFAYYDAKSISLDTLRNIITEAWNAVPDSYINTLYESWWRRCQAVIDARGGPTRY